MKKFNLLIACLITLCFLSVASVAKAADEVNITGTWNLNVKTESGQGGSPIFVLKQDGNKLTGTYKGYFGEAPVKGTVKGENFEMKYGRPGQEIIYKGKSDGKKMSGEIDFAGQDKGTFTGEKQQN